MSEKEKKDASTVMIVDDEQGLCDLLEVVLGDEGYHVKSFYSGAPALQAYKPEDYDVVISDIRMEGINGIELLRALKGINPNVLLIVITAYTNWSDAVEAMRLGAFDYIKKPFDNDDIIAAVRKAVRYAKEIESRSKDEPLVMRNLVGNSPGIQEVRRMISRVAVTDATVFIHGESGSGKELVARAIHDVSLRADQPLFAVNCGALAEGLLESELFGHVKGSFTGAVVNKRGMFEVADGGTLFLDEITELAPSMQVKLLRVLEEREVRPVGSTDSVKVDVRIIAASNKIVEKEVANGTFREDLFYRLNVIYLQLPPLRERREDIPLIAGNLLSRFAAELKKPIKKLDDEALESLMNYDWPGNVRELGNTLQRAMVLSEGEVIRRADLVGRLRTRVPADRIPATDIPPDGINLETRLEEIEKKYIRAALEKTGGNITHAAELLQMSFRSLRYKIKRLGLKTS